MDGSVLQQHLDEVRADVRRALSLFGAAPVQPPTNIAPDESVVQKFVK
ncbi:hypothetical protein [Mycolicibacterium peregrinum]